MEEKEEEEKVEGGRWVKRREVSSGALDIPVVQDFQGGPQNRPHPGLGWGRGWVWVCVRVVLGLGLVWLEGSRTLCCTKDYWTRRRRVLSSSRDKHPGLHLGECVCWFGGACFGPGPLL